MPFRGSRLKTEVLTFWLNPKLKKFNFFCLFFIEGFPNDPDVTIRRFEAEQRKTLNLSSLSSAISDTGFIPFDQFAESISAIISTINYQSQIQSE